MSQEQLFKNLLELVEGMRSCVSRKAILPSLVLFFSALDTLGWLASEDAYATRDSFIAWVDKYLLASSSLECTAIDLYAARCGLVHTFTSDSRLSSRGRARQICWSWGSADKDALRTRVDALRTDALVAVHLDDLHDAWFAGLQTFLDEIEATPELEARVHSKAERFYASMDPACLTGDAPI